MDREKVWGFLEQFTASAAGFTTVALLAIADRVGLLLELANGGPGTPAELAARANLDRRYVQEILSGLAAAGVVSYASESDRFELPAEHAAVVADDTSPYSMAGWLDTLPAVLERLPELVDATRNGGGVALSAYSDRIVRGIDRANSPGLSILLTRRWLPAMPDVMSTLETGGRVADIGCGSGTAALTMARAYPKSEVLGIDNDERSIERARERSREVPNLTFELGDASDLDTGFDLVTSFDVIHDLAEPLAVLRAVRRAVEPGGVFFMMEPNVAAGLEDNIHPRGALLYGISALLCMPQSLAQGGAGLGAAWGPEEAENLCREAGFGSFTRLPIDNPFSAFYRAEP